MRLRALSLLMPSSSRQAWRQRGATLVEMVMVIVILAGGTVAVMDQFVNSSRSYQTNEATQTAAQLAQQCAEHILATRRLQGHAAATATPTICDALPVFTGYTPTVSFAVAPTPPCVTAPCTLVTVTVTQGGNPRASVVFMLGNY